MPLTQKQRAAKRRRLDREDAIACAERARDRCEVCGKWAPYNAGGSNHHARRKKTEEIRRNRAWHVWLCWRCHVLTEESNDEGVNDAVEQVIAKREAKK